MTRKKRSIGIVQAIALAAGAAALGAAFSFLGAAFSLLSRNNRELDSLISSSPASTGRIVSRTLRTVQTSVGCSGEAIQDQANSALERRRGLRMNQEPSATTTSTTTVQVVPSKDDSTPVEQETVLPPRNFENLPVVESAARGESSGTGLGVAWLMSFPNSGTSYTIHLIRETSNTTTATNYALEGDIKDEASVPAVQGSEDGPYLELIKTIQTTIPEKYILTKTHCGGFCSNCLPLNYIETPRSFQISCLSGRKAVELATNSTGGVRLQQVRYSSDIVKKAVHVIRSPFDNIVARFHLEQKRHTRVGDTAWLTAHPNDKLGFQTWCAGVDASNELMEARWTDPELSRALEGVPCHAEFFRYIQWHNLAFTAALDIGVPTFVLHYEDYRDRFDSTLEGLLAFLELPHVKKGPAFDIGKEYAEFYSDAQREAVAGLVQELASLESWLQMKHYFASSLSVQED